MIYTVISADREGREASVQAETVTYLDSQHILPAKYTAARLMSTYRGQFVQARLPLAWDELESSGDLNEKRTNTHTPTQRRKSGAITAEFVPECELMSADLSVRLMGH